MKKILSILSILSITSFGIWGFIDYSNIKIEEKLPPTPNLNKGLEDLEKETSFNPYGWTKETQDETIKQEFLNYCHRSIKDFNENLVNDILIKRNSIVWQNQIIIFIIYDNQNYFIKTGISW